MASPEVLQAARYYGLAPWELTKEQVETVVRLSGSEETKPTLYYFEGLWLSEDGEVMDLEGVPEAFRPTEADAEEAVQVTEADVEWALRKFARMDGAILADDTRRKAETKAIEGNLKPGINRLLRSREWFENYVGGRLRAYATAVLSVRNAGKAPDKVEKTVKTPFGKLSFVALPDGSVAKPERDADVRAATEWVQAHFPHAIRQEPVLALDLLTADDREKLFMVAEGKVTEEEAGFASPCPLKVTPPGDQFRIGTGISHGLKAKP